MRLGSDIAVGVLAQIVSGTAPAFPLDSAEESIAAAVLTRIERCTAAAKLAWPEIDIAVAVLGQVEKSVAVAEAEAPHGADVAPKISVQVLVDIEFAVLHQIV